ncbi:MAG TPA: phosphoribosylformylglycinamidine synthase subunit PurL [Acidimicrobiales bacterium]|nr:phosphoribosylformylglycinamidine synthase subunit PurL [Acidimicrobiales bacterium]
MTGTLHRALGLTDEEHARIVEILGRDPNELELALYGVMWSEHCSYKSSRLHLRRLPTTGERVLVGPGENAGVIDAGDGIAVAIRIESHNHPSAIEPHQGAATGVGGILRDIFTMGARPLAVMDPLFFGPPDGARQRWLLEGVVSGISSYGNSVGVPTVGGELTFDPCYAGNPLVNVLCLGALPVDRLVLGRASGGGNLAVLLGATTGRDGIGGVSVLASAGFSGEADEAKRPNVQVGDPFEEKRLIEACLALLDAGLVVGIQDLGGAGLACATSETAARGGVGMDVDVGAVPRREPGMAPWEVMTSESQERMLAIVTPGSWPAVEALCRRWEVRASVVGTVTEDAAHPGRLRVRDGDNVVGDVPAASLADDAPVYDRPMHPPADLDRRRSDDPTGTEAPADCAAELAALLVDPSWVYRQYDHQLFLNTVVGPGADAALLRLAGPGLPPSERGVAVTTDSAPRWCAIDPRAGVALVLAEAVANLACVGATPVAVVNCLNFGNPEHPEVMWQLSETVDGLADACRAFGLPVVGGNVSLYNETTGADISPTPVLGVLGLVDRLVERPPPMALVPGSTVVLLGARRAAGRSPHPLGGSRWAVECRGRRHGALPALDAAAHARLAAFVASLVADALGGGGSVLCGVHDVSGGGLGVALAEMAVAGGSGVRVAGVDGHAELFTELPSRVLAATDAPVELCARAEAAGVPASVIGTAGGPRFAVEGLVDVSLDELTASWAGALARRLEPA